MGLKERENTLLMDQYIAAIEKLVHTAGTKQKQVILKAAERIADSIEEGGILHVFGSGHSHMIAEDLFHRAGGLICVNAMLEPSLMELNIGRATQLERLSGYADVLLGGYDLKAGEVILIVSNSGINAVPIEMALACKKRGLYVIALTNMDHSKRVESRHPEGLKLYEAADLVLDNGGVYGDAIISYGQGMGSVIGAGGQPFEAGASLRVGPTSTIGGILVVQTLMMAVTEALLQRGVEPPVLVSANTAGGDEHNRAYISRYRDRIRYLL